MLVQLVYVSIATVSFAPEDLVELLRQTRARNQERDLTGMLLFGDGNIVQVLEGPAEQVDRTFAAIEADPRHSRVRALWREPVDHRVFADWSMGFRALSPDDADGLEGFTDFLRSGSLVDLPAEPSLAVLRAFRATTT